MELKLLRVFSGSLYWKSEKIIFRRQIEDSIQNQFQPTKNHRNKHNYSPGSPRPNKEWSFPVKYRQNGGSSMAMLVYRSVFFCYTKTNSSIRC